MPPDGVMPVVVTVQPIQPSCGANVTFTVTLSGNAQGTEVYDVGASPSSAFSSIPPTCSPEAGADQLTFPATVSSGYLGAAQVSVTSGGEGPSCRMKIVPPS